MSDIFKHKIFTFDSKNKCIQNGSRIYYFVCFNIDRLEFKLSNKKDDQKTLVFPLEAFLNKDEHKNYLHWHIKKFPEDCI